VNDETYSDLDRAGGRRVVVVDDNWSSNGILEKGMFVLCIRSSIHGSG